MGKNKKIKRLKSESPVPSDEPCHKIIPMFPNEVWMIILRNLKDSPKSLFTFRFVSRDFKSLADAVLKENASLWKPPPTPWEYEQEMFTELAKEAKGIRFSTAKQVKTFLSKSKKCSWNPFPNGTVIFGSSHYNQANRCDELYDVFVALVSAHHEEIFTLVYYFKNSTNLGQLNTQLENIFRLKKLRHLVIVCEDGHVDEYLKADQISPIASALLSNVTELQVFGRGEETLMSYLIRSLLTPVNSSCKRLQIQLDTYRRSVGRTMQTARIPFAIRKWFLPHEPLLGDKNPNPFDFPKLEEFKMLAPNIRINWQDLEWLTHRKSPALQKVSIRLNTASTIEIGQLMEILEESAASLLMLHVKMLINYIGRTPLRGFNPAINYNEEKKPQFKKMTHLAIGYYAISEWRKLLPYFKQRFANLKELTIAGTKSDLGSNMSRPCEIRALLMDLWRDFPTTLEVIHVPYFCWSLNRAGSG